MSRGIDVALARADTPGCAEVVHLNHAGCSLPPRVVLDAQIEWLRAEAVTGGYELAAARAAEQARTYDEVAALVGAAPDEIALVENATIGWHQAFWSLPLRPGDRVLTAGAEYATGFISMLQAERRLGVTGVGDLRRDHRLVCAELRRKRSQRGLGGAHRRAS